VCSNCTTISKKSHSKEGEDDDDSDAPFQSLQAPTVPFDPPPQTGAHTAKTVPTTVGERRGLVSCKYVLNMYTAQMGEISDGF
jgi:hypothetical protein